MKVLHLCLGNFYIDNYSYQENMITKYHKEMGYDVKILASLVTFDSNGNLSYLDEASEYVNSDGIPVTRLNYKKPTKFYKRFRRYVGTFEEIERFAPDVLFIHEFQFMDIDKVVKYIKLHPEVKVYVDNHADFSNSATNFLSKNILHKIFWYRCGKLIEPYAKKFYGVLPSRVEFLKNVYKINPNKIELLVMGADDKLAAEAAKPEKVKALRDKYKIADDDFLIVTGGKIDLFKTQTLLLMEAVNRMKNPKVKLLVFGSVVNELKEKINALCSDRVKYIGWIKSDDSYDYFAASQLAVFPGRHSVFWGQVAGQGIPMIVKYWDGTDDVDLGGNLMFLYKDSVDEIENSINAAIKNYDAMKKVAEDKAYVFSYRDIAKRSISED